MEKSPEKTEQLKHIPFYQGQGISQGSWLQIAEVSPGNWNKERDLVESYQVGHRI